SNAFTVSLSNATNPTITAHYITPADTATLADAVSSAPTCTVPFAPGETSHTVTVQVVGDTKFEPTETFFVNLDTPVNATIADGQIGGASRREGAQTTAGADAVSNKEGNSGTTRDNVADRQSKAITQ